MRLLVTRPELEATRTAERLRALGHEPVIAPMLQTVFLDPPLPAIDPAAILLTSLNGLRALARWPLPAAWFALPVLAVGDRTAAAARGAGFADVRSADGDGVALAELTLATLPPTAGTLLYPAAVDRAGNWTETLAQAGYELALVEAYRMDPAASLPDSAATSLREGRIDGVLLYSPRTATALVRCLAALDPPARLDGLTIYALSENVAAALRAGNLRFGTIRIAEKPTDDALLALLPGSVGTSPSGVR
ncbi:uroporphyrinogen III methyltransferase [Kaistia sp. 32K]|uniref:uroporphyrinogen-III synthase n=1 Tax=Kaistia sp. 32K TaxID=2795690 RepID=UPI001915AA49|nr:uroporphyrinogen-III synthase [Kaistia sp. 32K]BCP55696.1 uroporphyrinogen III methyltransferase [Kaistia sp. 32K]